jgi:predicted ArsR family transcriptional regulator
VLLALEHGPQTAAQLAGVLGVEDHDVHYALKVLRARGLVHIAEQRDTSGNVGAAVYKVSHRGWGHLVKAAEALLQPPS